jgi:hypothetical protein
MIANILPLLVDKRRELRLRISRSLEERATKEIKHRSDP